MNIEEQFKLGCDFCSYPIIKRCIKEGVDVNKERIFQIEPYAPIVYILRNTTKWESQDLLWDQKAACMMLLLDAGADPNVCDQNGKPLIFLALQNDCILRVVLQYNVDLTVRWQRMSILELACLQSNYEAIIILLHHDMDPNEPDSDGCTALYWTEHSGCAELLLHFGADPRIRNVKGSPAAKNKSWAKKLLAHWTPYDMIPVWTFTHKAFHAYCDHCPGFRDGIMTLLLCLLRYRALICRQLNRKIVQYVAQGHESVQWWPILDFSIEEYI